jgi:hypothetical protein
MLKTDGSPMLLTASLSLQIFTELRVLTTLTIAMPGTCSDIQGFERLLHIKEISDLHVNRDVTRQCQPRSCSPAYSALPASL